MLLEDKLLFQYVGLVTAGLVGWKDGPPQLGTLHDLVSVGISVQVRKLGKVKSRSWKSLFQSDLKKLLGHLTRQ